MNASNYFDEDYIPGTINVLNANDDSSITTTKPIKRSKNGIILLPQPSDSPNDPLNWSFLRKAWHFALVSFFTGLTAAISNDAGAAQDSLNKIYGISYDAMNTGAGVLFIFIGWSCIFLAPASSLYGRKISYLVCLLCGCCGSIWFAVANKTSDTIYSQIFVGISESAAEAQAQQSLSDIFFQHQLGSVLTVYILATSVGSFLGPLIAHLISQSQTFRWVGWWGAIITGISLIIFIFTCEETVFDRSSYFPVYDSNLNDDKQSLDQQQNIVQDIDLEKKDSNKDVNDNPQNLITVTSKIENNNNINNEKAESEPLWPIHKRLAIITPSPYLEGYGFKQYLQRFIVYFKVFTLPAVWISGILWGLQDAYMTFFLTTQDTFFPEDPWNYSETGVAIMNVATLVGAVFGCFMSGVLSDKHVLWLAKRNNGILEPEFRLWLLFITLIVSPVGLLLFGIGAEKSWSPYAIYIGLGCIGFGWGLIGDTAMSYLMDAYPDIVIQGMVGVSIINNTLACIFTFVCSLWLDSAGTANTYIALAVIDFVSIAFIIPTLLWGKTWRKRTRKLYAQLVELTQGMG